MRTPLLSLIALLLLSGTAIGQINAGDVPISTSAANVGIDITLSTPFSMATAPFDLDCDSVPDLTAVLIYGEPAIDAPNYARLDQLDPDLELCKDMAVYERPQYYAFGQPLDCTGSFDWQSDSINVLGDIGTFTAIGPALIDSMYVAYRSGTQVGWILLSFDLNGSLGTPVRFQIHQILQLCHGTSISTNAPAPVVALFPNPNNGQPIHVQSPDALRSIEVLDPAGKILARYGGTVRTIAAPEVAGTYFVRALHADGRRSITRLVRY